MGTVADKPAYQRRRFRTGDGEIVPRRWAQRSARQLFLGALIGRVPEACADLWKPEMVGLRVAQQEADAAMWDALRATDEGALERDDHDDPSIIAWDRASALSTQADHALDHAIDEWQDRYKLWGDWLHRAGTATVQLACIPPEGEARSWGTLPGISEAKRGKVMRLGVYDAHQNLLYEGKHDPQDPLDRLSELTFIPEHLQRTRSVYLDQLKHPPFEHDNGWYEEDEGDFGTFDPRAETIDDAVKRLMPELEARLRHSLAQMVVEDTAGDTVPVRDLPPIHHFDWTVRYQVLGESMGDIARAAGYSETAVRTAIHEVKNLIGLTLREKNKPGPKRGTKYRPRIRH